MEMQAEGIRLQSAKYERVQNLMHNVNEQTLMAEHRNQSRRKAAGIDGVTKEEYDKNAEANIQDLMQRMQKFQYKPLPVKRVYIPKGNLPSYEDKLVQGVMAKLLRALKPRLGKFSLELAGEKTRILPIGRFKGTKEDFYFLGFTFSTQKPDCQSRIRQPISGTGIK